MSSTELYRAIRLSGKSGALLLSASLHAAIALAAGSGAPHRATVKNRADESMLNIAELDLTSTTVPAEAAAEPTQTQKQVRAAPPPARHHHDYPVPPDHDAFAHDPELRHTSPLATSTVLQPPLTVPAPVAESPGPVTPHFVMTVGATSPSPSGSGSDPAATSTATVATAPVAEASVDVPAGLLVGGPPGYTHEAQAAGVEADLPLEIVIDASGTVLSARALARVGYGLDEAALRSVRGYRFSPARRAGRAVPVRMHWLMRFQLR